jgi:hypothetical protein
MEVKEKRIVSVTATEVLVWLGCQNLTAWAVEDMRHHRENDTVVIVLAERTAHGNLPTVGV